MGIAATFTVAAVMGVAIFGTTGIVPLAGVVTATALLGIGFLGFSIGLSASVSTAKRSMGAGFGIFLGLAFLWEPFVAGLYYLVEGSLPGGELPVWILAVERLNPIEAYAIVANIVSDVGVTPLRISLGLIGGPSTAAEGSSVSVPFLLMEPFGIAVLCGWLVIPMALGTLQFQRSDLT
jgi:ABC-2 type transport system permease protein